MKSRKLNYFIVFLFILVVVINLVGYLRLNNKFDNSDYSVAESNEIIVDEDKIFIKKMGNEVNIYVKGSNIESKNFIGYTFKHLENVDKDAIDNPNYDVWKIYTADEYRLNDFGNFKKVKDVVRKGEWELALKETGANDFVGGTAHGDEITTSVEFFIDNEVVEDLETFSGWVSDLKVLTSSELFRDSSITVGPEQIGTVSKEYNFSSEGVSIEESISFQEDLILEKSFLAMLPIYRYNEEGDLITDTVTVGENSYDISEEGFNIPEISYIDNNQATISGTKSGITAKVEIAEKSEDLSTIFHVSNRDDYNKLYFGYNPDGYNVYSGDVWQQKVNYQIDTSN